MAELEQVPRRGHAAGGIVDLDRVVLGPRRRVDEHDGQAGTAYRLDVARASARSIDPCSGEMNSSPKPRSSVTVATPSAKSAKNGLPKTCASACGDRMPIVAVEPAVSIRATG
jgi:hypothetical protein